MEFFAEPAIGVIIGTNGYVWIEACRRNDSLTPVSEQERYQIAVLRNAICILDKAKVPIFKDTILKVVEEQQMAHVHPKDMFENSELMASGAVQMISEEIGSMKPIDIQQLMS